MRVGETTGLLLSACRAKGAVIRADERIMAIVFASAAATVMIKQKGLGCLAGGEYRNYFSLSLAQRETVFSPRGIHPT
jgi:hypothetical protein